MSYIKPINVYPSVIPVGRTLTYVEEILKPFCRSYSENTEVKYKPLGNLKRSRPLNVKETGETEDNSIDELFDDYPLNHLKHKILREDKWPSESNLSVCCEGVVRPAAISTTTSVPNAALEDFLECEESNGEDDDEEEEEQAEELKLVQTADSITATRAIAQSTDNCEIRLPEGCSVPTTATTTENVLPRWNSFFNSQAVEGDCERNPDTSEEEREKNSQSPKLFSESDDDSTHISSSQSTHISEHGSQEWDSQADTVLLSSQERRAAELHCMNRGTCFLSTISWTPQTGESKAGIPGDNGNGERIETSDIGCNPCLQTRDQTTPHSDGRADSQSSSDFEIPSTPGAEQPRPEKLHYLYERLATGDVITASKQS